jgi:hypothetical protein
LQWCTSQQETILSLDLTNNHTQFGGFILDP